MTLRQRIPSNFLSLFSFYINHRNKKIIHQCYRDILAREPDQMGFNHYFKMMKSSINPTGIGKKELIEILKNSDEYKTVKLAEIYDQKPCYVFKGLYDIKYLVRPNSVLDNIVVKKGIYNKWLCAKIKSLVHEDATIFDIGANVGLLSLPFANICVPKGCVYSFEPDHEVFKQLRKNVLLNNTSNIIVKRVALQDDTKINKIILNINRVIHNNGLHNGLRNDGLSTIEENSIYQVGRELVKATTVDNFVKENRIRKLEFIKIDTQGSEYKILSGAKNTIKKFHPIIFYEYETVVGGAVNFKNIERAFKLMNQRSYKQYFIPKNKKANPALMENFSTGLPDGDVICFHDDAKSIP